MRAGEAYLWANLAAGTFNASNYRNAPSTSKGNLVLQGGLYELTYIGTNPTSCTLEQLGPDGSTWITIYLIDPTTGDYVADLTASGSYGFAKVPPGQYRIVVATSTANYVGLTRIPDSE